MGLAASQARLLCITMRITDDQYQLMKLSSQQLSLSAKSADIDEQYDYMKNAVNYSYNGNENFTYSDLMGASGLTAGLESPVFVTNKDNKIVLDGAYGMAMQSAYMASSGKPKGSATGFNAFVAQITGDSTTDWYKAAQGIAPGTSSGSSSSDSNSTLSIPSGAYKVAYTSTPLAGKDRNQSGMIGYNTGFDDATAKKYMEEFIKKYGELPIVDQNNGSLLENSKGYKRSDWMSELTKYAKANGFTVENSTNTLKVNGKMYCQEAPSGATAGSTSSSSVSSGSINEDGTVNDEKTIKAAKYYLQIYNQACNGYVVDEQITNRDYMNAQLENNNLKIGGKLASENEDIKKGLAKDNEDKLEQIKSWYNKETKSIKNEEKKIGLKQTSLQAEISALTTEQSSVQSLIDKNIERSFTYCQKG